MDDPRDSRVFISEIAELKFPILRDGRFEPIDFIGCGPVAVAGWPVVGLGRRALRAGDAGIQEKGSAVKEVVSGQSIKNRKSKIAARVNLPSNRRWG